MLSPAAERLNRHTRPSTRWRCHRLSKDGLPPQCQSLLPSLGWWLLGLHPMALQEGRHGQQAMQGGWSTSRLTSLWSGQAHQGEHNQKQQC